MRLIWLPLLLLILSCTRAPLQDPAQALRPAEDQPAQLTDDLPLDGLVAGMRAELPGLVGRTLHFGPKTVSGEAYAAALKRAIATWDEAPENTRHTLLLSTLVRDFEFYEVYGGKSWGDVFITSYFEPRIEGSRKKTSKFTQALYKAPPEIVTLDPGKFDASLKDFRKLRGRQKGREILPFYTREEIDSKGALANRGLEIAYVDPIEAFFLQIQGSGTLDLGGGKTIRVNYADKNGQAYQAVGAFLLDKIPKEKMSAQAIETAMRAMAPQELQSFLNRNPSYVFFKESSESAVTAFGVPAVDGRTIATDSKYFPKGALAWLKFERPIFAGQSEPSRFEPTSRLVFDQDTGGAITGGGRVDLFWGRGAEAKRYAGFMKGRGRLLYLVPRR